MTDFHQLDLSNYNEENNEWRKKKETGIDSASAKQRFSGNYRYYV